MERCPLDLRLISIMRAFPQYTREALLDEDAGFVERMEIVLSEEAKQQQLARLRANRRR